MERALLCLPLLAAMGACHPETEPHLRAVLEELEADSTYALDAPLPHLRGVVRLDNGTPDTLAFALSGARVVCPFGPTIWPPHPDAPGVFALVVGADTDGLASALGGACESNVPALVLAPGDSASVFLASPVIDLPPRADSASIAWAAYTSDYPPYERVMRWGDEAEVVYLPNPGGRYPFLALPMSDPDTLAGWSAAALRRYWARDTVRFARAPAR